MTFLSPSLLWLLGAISIPVLIHFMSRLRVNKVEFSTIRFIKELETSSIRKVQLQQFLLMLLRILAITALVLMMAKPVTQGFMPGWIAAEQDAHLVVILDNSASMSAKQNDVSHLGLAKDSFLSIAPNFKSETSISIFQTNPPLQIFDGKSNDPDIVSAVQSINETQSNDNLWHFLMSTLSELKVQEPIKECIIFSDFMVPPDSALVMNFNIQDDWKFYFIHPEPIYDNLSIRSVSSVNRMKTMSQLVKLNTRIQNSGSLHKVNVPLELLFDDHRVGQVVSEFDPGKEKEFLFQAYPGNKGIVEGKIVLPNDNYSLDNTWHVSMPIMDQINCGIIGSNAEDISMIEMILNAIDPQSQFISIDSRIQPDLNRLFLDELDVIIIHGTETITDEGIENLETFLKAGGGVIWFQGDQMEMASKSLLSTELNFPMPEKVIHAGQGFFTTHLNGIHSDLLQNLSVRHIDDELPEVFKYSKLKINSKHKTHWHLNNGDPLLIEFSNGSGQIFYFSSLLDLRWNDLAIRGMVIPMMYQLLVLTGTDEINTRPVTVDGPKWISIEEKLLHHTWEVETPSGRRELIVPDYNSEGILIESTQELGIYRVYANGKIFTLFATHLHESEYIQPRCDESLVSALLPTGRWLMIQDNFSQIFSETRQGKSLWKLFLVIALVLLLIETILGRPEPKTLKNDS